MTMREHRGRLSDSSLYDEVCEDCGATDAGPRWRQPCSGVRPPGQAAWEECAVGDLDAALVEAIKARMREARREAFMDGYVLGASHATESFAKAADRRNRDDYFPTWHRLRFGY